MNRKRLLMACSFVMIMSMMLTACQPQVIVETRVVEKEVKSTVVVTEIVAGTAVEKIIEKVVTPTVPAATPTTPPAELKMVDSIVIGMQQEPDSLHPLLGSMSAKFYVQNLLYVGCMGQDEKPEWIPLGCESVPTIENGGAKIVGDGDDKHLEVTYKIREGWRWNDGVPVTSDDILYWWKLAMEPDFPIAARTVIEKIYDIVALDDRTAVVSYLSKKQLNEAIKGTLTGNVNFAAFQEDYKATYGESWNAFAVDPVFWNNIYWLPEHILKDIPAAEQEASEYSRNPVGDGPFVLQEWKAGQELVLVKSDKPFPLGDPKLKTVTFRIFGDAAGVLAALANGELDSATGNVGGLTEAEGPDLDAIEAQGKIKVLWNKGWDFEHLDLNVTHPPLDDPKVRQALWYALDIEAINQAVYYGKKSLSILPLPLGVWAYPKEGELNPYKYDPEKAKQLLKDAGWDCTSKPCTKGDLTLSFTLMTTDRPSRIKASQIMQQMWGQINVGVNLQSLYGRQLFNTCQTGGPLYCRTFDAAMYTFSTDDSATFFGLYSTTSIPTEANAWSGQNSPGWSNQKAVDALNISENDPEVALSREKRLPYLLTFFKELNADVPVIYLWGSAEPFPYTAGWKNFRPGPTQFSLMTWNSWEWEVYK
jgi:peptide/nickel transport system substrate-binding protein